MIASSTVYLYVSAPRKNVRTFSAIADVIGVTGFADVVAPKPNMAATIKLVAIDDTPASLELLSESLAQDGLTILTATDPEKGLDLIFQEHPQIVLLDLVMPKMTGLEVLERVVDFDPGIDVILMTAHYTSETAV
jgi:response regulator RpfG family c-di-GMP phosphodiesterase